MYEGVPWWSVTEANDAINEALREWNALTGRWRQTVVLPTNPAAYEYSLPNAILYRMRISFNTKPMSSTTREDLNNGRPRWRQETTATGGSVPTRPMLWCPLSLRSVYIWPADALGHNALTVEGVADTPVLLLDGSFVDLAEADISTLLGYCLHVLSLSKGGVWFQASAPYFRAFLAAAAEENGLIKASQMYRTFMGLDNRQLKRLTVPTEPVTLPGTRS